jgi:transmembrane protein
MNSSSIGGVVGRANTRSTPTWVERLLDNPLTLFIARVWVISPFLVSGLGKLLDWHSGEAEMLHVGLHPAWLFNTAALITELGGSFLIVFNRKVWLGAGALGVFTVLTIFLAHRFWELSGTSRVMELNSFFEHWTISAAFILVTVVAIRDRRRG